MIRFLRNTLLGIALGTGCLPHMVQAAYWSAIPTSPEIAVGQFTKVTIQVDPQSQSINAVEGRLVISSGNAEITNIATGGSVVSIWIKQQVASDRQSVAFAGVTPGGFSQTGLVLTATVQATGTGSIGLALENIRALQNDGLGTPASITLSTSQIRVTPPRSTVPDLLDPLLTPDSPTPDDTIGPEKFEVKIISNPDTFGGDWYLAFSASDGQSGVDHYEVKEPGYPWITAESPYRLQNQDLPGRILVRAVDEFGNSTEVGVHPPLRTNNLIWYIVVGLLALVAIIVEAIHIFRLEKGLKGRRKS